MNVFFRVKPEKMKTKQVEGVKPTLNEQDGDGEKG